MPYECHMCLKKFRQKQGLNAHVKANRCQMGAIRPSARERDTSDGKSPGFCAIGGEFKGEFKVENVLTIEAIKKLTSSPMTVKVNGKKREREPECAEPGIVSNTVHDPPTQNGIQTRPIDLSLLSNGFTDFLKKVETHPNNCEAPVSQSSCPVSLSRQLPHPAAISATSPRKEINTSLSEMEKSQIIKDVKTLVCRKSRRKQGTILRN